jgi:hypothetical protein
MAELAIFLVLSPAPGTSHAGHVTSSGTELAWALLQARFEWHDDAYDLAVTDPLWEPLFAELGEGEYGADQIGLNPEDRTLLTISLSEPMTTGYCFKLVAGVLVLDPAADGRDAGSGL